MTPAELRQWMSDACEALQEIIDEQHVPYRDRLMEYGPIRELLKRAENL